MSRIDSPDFQREFNIKCAEFLNYDIVGHSVYGLPVYVLDGQYGTFDPCNDANDLEVVIAKMRLCVKYSFEADV